MILLGIDPGLAILGYGVIKVSGLDTSLLDYGTVQTQASQPFPERLQRLYQGVGELLELYKPNAAVFEELFFCKNVATAMQVGAARGVAVLRTQQAGLPLYEYTPMQIKQAVTGNGHAQKLQVQNMIKILLGLKKIPKPDDAADALAIAVCHAHISKAMLEEFRIQ